MDYPALQHEGELAKLAELFVRDNVRSYLEIGSRHGGSLWRIAMALPPPARIVSIDVKCHSSLILCTKDLRKAGHDVWMLHGNSTNPKIITKARKLGPFDAILIDGDHKLRGLKQDWLNYGPMGRIIAFHDISWRRAPEWVGARIDVPEFWSGIKDDYRHSEFRMCPTAKNNGIGVLWQSWSRPV